MKLTTASLDDNGHSLVLTVRANEQLLRLQARVCAQVLGQTPVQELHITLGSATQLPGRLPPPPAEVQLLPEAWLVSEAGKSSVYLKLDAASQAGLAAYVQALQPSSGSQGLFEADRIFHLSLTNRTGLPGDSVARIWTLPATPLRLTVPD